MTTISLIFSLLVLLTLFVLSACFSGSETVLFSLSAMQVQRIKTRNPVAGERLEGLLKRPSTVLSTLLVGNSFVNFAIASIGYLTLDKLTPDYAEIICVPLLTLLLLLFGEVTPKRLAVGHAERIAPLCSFFVLASIWILRPFSFFMDSTSRILFRKAIRKERQKLNDDELLTVVEVSASQGILDDEEVSMVDGIMRLSELQTSDEMIPRVNMIGIDLDDPIGDIVHTARVSQHRYLPVYRKTPDAVEGFLDTVAFLLDTNHVLKDAISPAMLVPENLPLDKLLLRFQTEKQEIACVVDEYGGTAGIITRGDILELVAEPVVGGAQGLQQEEIRQESANTWLLAGTASLKEVNHAADIELSADDADRISGWITLYSERIPYPGMVVTAQNCRVTVLSMSKHRVTAVRLTVLRRQEEETDVEDFLAEEDAAVESEPQNQNPKEEK
ncbi:MAG: HlyC/CorC family transporter [Kiritimatiellae bacterium]|nr:HlyC/CorC family transporter [Kiritimatiellia bacterium]